MTGMTDMNEQFNDGFTDVERVRAISNASGLVPSRYTMTSIQVNLGTQEEDVPILKGIKHSAICLVTPSHRMNSVINYIHKRVKAIIKCWEDVVFKIIVKPCIKQKMIKIR